MRTNLIFCSLVFLSSCALLGSRATVYQVPVKPLKHVAVIIAQETYVSGNENEMEYLLFTKTMAEELSKKKIFRYTILDKRISSFAFTDLETSLMSQELSEKYDAYLLCVPGTRGRNYKVDLTLIQTRPSAVLIHARHSTAVGNSYWYYQPTSSMLIDATRGAVNALALKLETLSQP